MITQMESPLDNL